MNTNWMQFFFRILVIIILILGMVMLCGINNSHARPVDKLMSVARLKRVKYKLKNQLHTKAYVRGDRKVIYPQKKDFVISAFEEIKDLCDTIKCVDIFFEAGRFKIKIILSDKRALFYTKVLEDKEEPSMQKFSGLISLQLKGENSVQSCHEFRKIIEFIQWNYKINNYKHLTSGVPEFVSKKIKGYNIRQSFRLL